MTLSRIGVHMQVMSRSGLCMQAICLCMQAICRAGLCMGRSGLCMQAMS